MTTPVSEPSTGPRSTPVSEPSIGARSETGGRTLRGRLVFSFLTISLATLALVSTVAFFRSRQTLQTLMFERLTTVVAGNKEVLNRWVMEQERSLRFLSTVPAIAQHVQSLTQGPQAIHERDMSVRSANAFLRQAAAHSDFEELLLLLPVGGEVVASTSPARLGEYYVDSLFFTRGKTETFIQNVYASPTTSRPTVTIATPIRTDAGETLGVLAGHLNLERLEHMLAARTELGESSESYLVSAFNDFVSADRFGRAEHRRGVHSEGIDRAVSGHNGVGGYRNYIDVPVIGAYAWIAERELGLIVEMEQAEAFAPARELTLTILSVGLLSMILLTFGVRFVAEQIARPVVSLSVAASRVAAGDFSVEAEVSTDDELGVLADSFNRMTRKLRLLYSDLKEQIETTRTARDGLARARDEAESATRAKSDFLARMSHEIRTPLNAVLGMSSLIRRTELDPAQQDYATKIQGSAQHLLAIINEILDFSKLEARGVRLEERAFDLHDLVDNVAGLVPQASEAVSVVLQVRPDVPRSLVGDPLRLAQVLANLISNAVKFTHQGEIHMLAALASDRGRTVGIRFSVRDTGIGIDPEALGGLFGAFAQADESTTRRYGGTGLGLSICKELVELMGGEIEVTSALGAGSRFEFTAHFAMPDAVAQPKLHGVSLAGARIGLKVDHSTTRDMLVELLESEGATVVIVSGVASSTQSLDSTVVDWSALEVERSGRDAVATALFLVDAHRVIEATSGSNAIPGAQCLVAPVTRNALLQKLATIRRGEEERIVSGNELDSVSLVGARILVVEDNPINQQIVREVLIQAGATVNVASHGRRALELVESTAFDVMLLDIQMPGMSGFEVARVIAARGEKSPVILVLSADPTSREQALAEPAIREYLTKPIEPEVLLESVARALNVERSAFRRVLDVAAGVRRAAGNEQLFWKLIASLVAKEERVAEEVAELLARGEQELAERRLHNLKGVAANLAADEVSDASAGALDELRGGQTLGSEVLDKLAAGMTRLSAAVASHRSEIAPEARAELEEVRP